MYYAKRKAFINFAPKHRRVLWARSHLRWTKRQWECVLWSDVSTFQLVFGKRRRWILRIRNEKDHPDCCQWKVQKKQPLSSAESWGDMIVQTAATNFLNRTIKYLSIYLWWYGGASMPTAWVICIYVKVPLRLMLEFFEWGQCQASFCTSYNSVAL